MERFEFEFSPRAKPLLGLLGFRPDTSEVVVDDTTLTARYGRFRVETPLTNVAEARVTGPYRWWRALGPRGSGKDRGATFGTTAAGGVCILFKDPVPGLFGERRKHTGLTVTVAERERLADLLNARKEG